METELKNPQILIGYREALYTKFQMAPFINELNADFENIKKVHYRKSQYNARRNKIVMESRIV